MEDQEGCGWLPIDGLYQHESVVNVPEMIVNKYIRYLFRGNVVQFQDIGKGLIPEQVRGKIETKTCSSMVFSAKVFVPGMCFPGKELFPEIVIDGIVVGIAIVSKQNEVYLTWSQRVMIQKGKQFRSGIEGVVEVKKGFHAGQSGISVALRVFPKGDKGCTFTGQSAGRTEVK